MGKKLNTLEKRVLSYCKRAAFQSDNGKECTYQDIYCCKPDSMGDKQLQGYLSQLIQKGYLSQLDGCYFDYLINELSAETLKK